MSGGVGWADVNGVALRYQLSGEGPPLVLLHEMGGTLESWADVTALLPGRCILRFDSRGAGMSQKLLATPTFDDLVDDLANLLDALAIKGPVAVVGVAVGAAVALRFAAQYSSRCGALVAMAPATGIAVAKRPMALELADRIAREGMRARVLERIDYSFPVEYRTSEARFRGFLGRALSHDPTSYAAIYRMLAEIDLSADLPAIACPVLVLAGRTDQTRPAAMVQQVADAIPGARFAEIASGHVMPMLTPELVAGFLDSFLTECGMMKTQATGQQCSFDVPQGQSGV